MANHDSAGLVGLEFLHPDTGAEYGLIRPLRPGLPPGDLPASYLPVAEDENSNYFLSTAQGSFHFWDHETGDLTLLATSWEKFRAGCRVPGPVTLDPKQVRSVWVSPDLAKKLGKQVPTDGWVKRDDSPSGG